MPLAAARTCEVPDWRRSQGWFGLISPTCSTSSRSRSLTQNIAAYKLCLALLCACASRRASSCRTAPRRGTAQRYIRCSAGGVLGPHSLTIETGTAGFRTSLPARFAGSSADHPPGTVARGRILLDRLDVRDVHHDGRRASCRSGQVHRLSRTARIRIRGQATRFTGKHSCRRETRPTAPTRSALRGHATGEPAACAPIRPIRPFDLNTRPEDGARRTASCAAGPYPAVVAQLHAERRRVTPDRRGRHTSDHRGPGDLGTDPPSVSRPPAAASSANYPASAPSALLLQQRAASHE